jgi:hypothetical protein
MLYFFHHYELPVILQQAQLQQLLIRTHRGMGMMGLAGIAALASGAAYHDAPGTATQATPPTTQSTTQTVQNTAQSTTQTSPSVSTAQTNTTHTGDVISSRTTSTETSATGTNTSSSEHEDTSTSVENIRNTEKDNLISSGDNIRIEEIARRNSKGCVTVSSDSHSTVDRENDRSNVLPRSTDDANVSTIREHVEAALDRRRKKNIGPNADDPPPTNELTERLAPRASPEADELD